MNSKLLTTIVMTLLLISNIGCTIKKEQDANQDRIKLTDKDKKEIKDLAENIPIILAEQGWDAYQKKFHKDYTNWYMTSNTYSDRETFLKMVKDWYEAGNKATKSTLIPIGFIPVDANTVLFLNAQQETFNDPNDPKKSSVRDMRFVSAYKKVDGKWQMLFTGFMDNPNVK